VKAGVDGEVSEAGIAWMTENRVSEILSPAFIRTGYTLQEEGAR